jgi:L-fuconolactonase
MKIDTHQHFWALVRGDYNWLTPDLVPLYRDFSPDDLAPLLDAANVDGTIAVQAADSEAETGYLLSLADKYEWIFGVVGWVDLAADSAPASIKRLAQNPKLVGLRPMIQDIADDNWMLQPALRPAIAAMIAHDLTFDALVLPRHLQILDLFATTYPDLRIVIDHGAKPEIKKRSFDTWAADMAQLSQHPQISVKLSGLTTEAGTNWHPRDLAPYVHHIANAFGPDRLLFGSDWPVLNLASDYQSWHDLSKTLCAGITDADMTCATYAAYPRLCLKENA